MPDSAHDKLSKPASEVLRTSAAASASATELRQFINSLRGRSPQEMLGTVAASGLFAATAQATIATVVLIVVFTFGPYWLKSDAKAAPKAAKPVATKPAEAEKPAVAATGAASETPNESDQKQAAKVMGMDETKAADPKVNPREKDLDKLLDGVN